ncbi:hypothetical protein [Flavobacterium sp.]|uniref:hypothetical protein n=1 Tax=Flavobacterium sp. TaxID=239 RepID=UPI00404887A5
MSKKATILLIILATLFFSCHNDYNPNYVDKTSSVLDSTYSSHMNEIKSLFHKIELLEPEKLLSSRTTFLDSTNASDIVPKAKSLSIKKPILNDSINLTSENTILINNSSNWFLFYGITDSIRNNLKYIISEFPKKSYENNSLYSADDVPNYFHYYNNQNFFKNYKDSIDLRQKKRIKSNHNPRVNGIKQIKYGLIINDIYVMKPYLVDENNFSGGFIISSVELYNLASKELLGHANIHVKNSKEVNHFRTIDFRNKIVNKTLQKDLLKEKTKEIINYFNIK